MGEIMNKGLQQVLKRHKQEVNNWYLAQEVLRKTAKFCDINKLSIFKGLDKLTFNYWPDVIENRPLNYLVWQLFEDLDEILNLHSITMKHYEEYQFITIKGSYLGKLSIDLDIYYSGLKTCKFETYQETKVINKTRIICE